MSHFQIILLLICVTAISAGQVLFKRAGLQLESKGSWLDTSVLYSIGLAALIYGIATLLWIHLLRDIELSKAYIFMALSFVIVPLAGFFLFNESISTSYIVGTALVVTGLVVVTAFN